MTPSNFQMIDGSIKKQNLEQPASFFHGIVVPQPSPQPSHNKQDTHKTHAVKHVWKTAFYFLVTDLLTKKKKKINNTLQQFLEKLDSSPEVHSSSAHALMSGPASVTGVSICPEPRVDLQNLNNFISYSLREVKQRQLFFILRWHINTGNLRTSVKWP